MTGERQGWAWGADPASVAVDCLGAQHTVRWQRGKVVLVDHDLSAERALVGMGGEPVPCLAVLEAWQNATLATFEVPPGTRNLMRRHGRVPTWVVDLEAGLVESRLLSLVVGYERAWRRRQPFVSGRNLVEELLRERAAPFLNRFVEGSGSVGSVPVQLSCNMLPPSRGEPSVDAWLQSGSLVVAVWLRPDWLRKVWLPRLALDDERFVVDLDADYRTLAMWVDDRTVVTTSEAVPASH